MEQCPCPPRRLIVAGAIATTAGIFAFDLFGPLDSAIPVLYIAVILLLAPLDRRMDADRKFHWPLGRRPDDHPGLSELGL